MSFLRVSDARAFVHESVRGGRCADDPEVLKAINAAEKMLMDEGDWKETTQTLRVCVYNGYAHLPRGVEGILKVGICGKATDAWHKAWEFVESGPGDIDMQPARCDLALLDAGMHPTFWPFLIEGMRLVALSDNAADIDVEMDVYGKEAPYFEDVRRGAGPSGGGEVLKIGQWTGGVQGEIDRTDMMTRISASTFDQVTAVRKPVTQGYITLFGYDPDTHAIQYLAKYHPNEVDPAFRWYRIAGALPDLFRTDSTADPYAVVVKCLVKIGHVDHIFDDEQLHIQNLLAIEMGIKSIEEKKRGNFQLGLAYQADAIRLLTKERKNHNREQKVIDVRMTGGMAPFGDLNEV